MKASYFNGSDWSSPYSFSEPAGRRYYPFDAISFENSSEKHIYFLYKDDSIYSGVNSVWKIIELVISNDVLPYSLNWIDEPLPSITESNDNMVYDLLYDGQTFYIGGSDGYNIYYRKLEGNQWTTPTLVARDIGDEYRLKWTPASNG